MKITPPKGGSGSTNASSSGSVGGDLGGSLPGPTVVGISGIPFSGVPTDGEVPTYDSGTNTITWEPVDITVEDEGTPLTTALDSIDFAGAGVTATNVGGAVTVTIPGGGDIQRTFAFFGG